MKKQNKILVVNARLLRKNMTKEERHLWFDFLRTYPVKFTRQKILGKYIADFYCSQANLVIEIDGSQHYFDEELKKDQERTKFLEQYGVKVVRFTNIDINNRFDEVCEYVDLLIKDIINNPSVS